CERITARIERSGGANYFEQALLSTDRQKLVKSAVVMANELRAKAILVFTRSGNMARTAAWMRPRYSQIYALCEREALARALALSWALTPFVVPFDLFEPQNTIETADQRWQWYPYKTNFTGSYGYNGWLYSGNYSISGLIIGASEDWKFGSEANVTKTANTPLFADAVWVDGWPQETEEPAKDLYN